MRMQSFLIAGAVGLLAPAPVWAQGPASFYTAPATTISGLSPAQAAPRAPLRQVQAPSPSPTRWRVNEMSRGGRNGGPVDTVRLSVAETRVGPSVGVISRAPYDATGFGLSYTRDWPDAMQFNAGRYGLAVSPHAGLALTNDGAVPEAGAMVRLSSGDPSIEDRLGGLVADGRRYGDQGRWYLFAAASGRTVGLNMTRADDGWSQAGWSTDRTSKLVGDGQLGLAYRKGAMQASFGYVYREIKIENGPLGADTDVSDSMAAFNLTLKPNF